MAKVDKVELVNQLVFLINIQEKVWRYHPDNPNPIDVREEYNRLQEEIKDITNQLDN
jgi:iron-sulfur cluster repair protein YtfE (RIC family)